MCGPTDRRTDSHSDYSANLRIVQYCSCYTGVVESIDEYILEQSVSVRAVPELIMGEAGRQSNFSAKPRPRFAYQWPDNVKMYK